MKNIEELLNKLEIKYKELRLYEKAFSHSSYVNESKDKTIESYERLEFLGDSILNNIVALYLFNNFEDRDPGELTLTRSYVVKKEFLAKIGKELQFEEYIKVGVGERKTKLSNSIYEDVFESLVAAIYLDAGYEEAKNFIINKICSKIKDIDIDNLKDYKTKLQEFLQNEKGKSVKYQKIDEKNNADGTKTFEAIAMFEENVLGKGMGQSIKKAEQAAAKEALNKVTKGV